MNVHMKAMMATTIVACSMVATPVYALENGAFTTSTTTNYINPDTGLTDDGGTQNAAIGEGMCRSIIGQTMLVEVEDGKVYATVRVHLYANMPSVGLKVQGTKGDPNSYYTVSHTVMQEDFYDDFADLRFEIPNVGTRIQCTAYVTPMGREVCFYFDIASNLTAYSGNDFIVSVATPAVIAEVEVVEVEIEAEAEEVVIEVEAVVELETEAEAVEEIAVEEIEEIEEEIEEVEAEEEVEEVDETETDEAETDEIEEVEEEAIAVMSLDAEEMAETAPGIEPRTVSEAEAVAEEEVDTVVATQESEESTMSWILIAGVVVVALGVLVAKKRKA